MILTQNLNILGEKQRCTSIWQSKFITPKESSKKGNEGTVYVQFTVTKDGKITNAAAVKGSGFELLDNEAVRVIENMPNWTPGTKDGSAIDVKMTLPIKFKLD